MIIDKGKIYLHKIRLDVMHKVSDTLLYFAVGKIDAKFIVGVKKYADKFSLMQNSNNFLIRQVFYFKNLHAFLIRKLFEGNFKYYLFAILFTPKIKFASILPTAK